MLKRRRVIVTLAMLVVAIAVISVTLGRDIQSDRAPGLGTFAIIHFAGYLFFLLMPVEALVPYYQADGHSGLLLVAIAVATAIGAQLIDYGIGYLVSGEVISSLIGPKRYQRFYRTVHRHGRWAILTFNLLPLSSPNVLLVSGIIRFPIVSAILYSLLGLTVKYIAIVYLFRLF